eukprot:GHVU01218833.1.p1 GENE.GHVU01218833.1~~GHVU01218833.1.p1  ORF type:complete len:304 (+),score=90.18 GHVU01218833.1:102-914(+)
MKEKDLLSKEMELRKKEAELSKKEKQILDRIARLVEQADAEAAGAPTEAKELAAKRIEADKGRDEAGGDGGDGKKRRLQTMPTSPESLKLRFTGPSTVRVEHAAKLLLLQQVSLDVETGLRNYGTLFAGAVTDPNCEEQSKRTGGVCAAPSINSEGYLLAKKPVTVHWLQISEHEADEKNTREIFDGMFNWDTRLPKADTSTVTIYGQVKVTRIEPGFSLSFSRLGFPPSDMLRPEREAAIEVVGEKSGDLMMYIDLFDDDGFVSCCDGA